MKKSRLANAMGYIDDALVSEAIDYKPKKIKHNWVKWGALAACLCLAVYTGVCFIAEPAPATPDIATKLPLLESQFESNGMGFEGVMLYDIAESGENPWTQAATFETLPVYKNLAYTDASGMPVYLSESKLLEIAEETAARLNAGITDTEFDRVDISQCPPDTDIVDGEAYRLTAITEKYTITVLGNGSTSIELTEPEILPDEYSFTSALTSYDDAISTINYLADEYMNLTGISHPAIYTWCDYTFSGEQMRRYFAYENDADIIQKMINFNFSKIGFTCTSNDGALERISCENLLSSAEKIGEYPVITSDDARELLLEGKYISTVPSEYLFEGAVNAEHIAKVELVYRTENTSKIFMPYYRFYVELNSEDTPEGLTNYGAFYVPAIDSEYLSDFPIWNGSFN